MKEESEELFWNDTPTETKSIFEKNYEQEWSDKKEYEYHEYANLFPMLPTEELNSLAEDIKQHGLINKITLYEGKIIDGRNRFEGCNIAGVEPRFTLLNESITDPLGYVISTNLKRRHLNESQRALVAAKLANMKEGGTGKNQYTNKQLVSNKPNLACSSKMTEIGKESIRLSDKYSEWIDTPENYSNKNNSISIEKSSKILNVSTGSVKAAKEVMTKYPDRVKEIESGKIAVSAVIKEEKKKEQIVQLKEKELEEITTEYDVIVLDPPWQMEKIEREVAPNQIGFDYPTMTEQEIMDFKIPNAKDCHVFMWTTHKHLPSAFEIFKSWNVKYVLTMVWHKNGGFQPFNLPQYNNEFILYGRIGTPIFTDTKAFNTCFSADRKGHSVKPEYFYELLNRVTSGKRIDIFNRRKIEGFDTYGNESV